MLFWMTIAIVWTCEQPNCDWQHQILCSILAIPRAMFVYQGSNSNNNNSLLRNVHVVFMMVDVAFSVPILTVDHVLQFAMHGIQRWPGSKVRTAVFLLDAHHDHLTMICFDMLWYVTRRPHVMTIYDMLWYVLWHVMTRYDMLWHVVTCMLWDCHVVCCCFMWRYVTHDICMFCTAVIQTCM